MERGYRGFQPSLTRQQSKPVQFETVAYPLDPYHPFDPTIPLTLFNYPPPLPINYYQPYHMFHSYEPTNLIDSNNHR